jgi:hypothetical protein
MFPGSGQDNRYAITLDDQIAGTIVDNRKIATGFLRSRNIVPVDELPEFSAIHLENLVGIDANGDTLDIGYAPLLIYKEITSAVKEVNLEDLQVSIFPNPASANLTIQQEEVYFRSIRIYQPEGRLVDQIKLSDSKQNTIDISNYENGLYIIELVSDDFQAHHKVLFTN